MERFDATLDRIERRLKEMLKEVENPMKKYEKAKRYDTER